MSSTGLVTNLRHKVAIFKGCEGFIDSQLYCHLRICKDVAKYFVNTGPYGGFEGVQTNPLSREEKNHTMSNFTQTVLFVSGSLNP